MLQHAVLVDTAFVRERIPSDDGLVVLHWEVRHRRDKTRRARQHRCLDAGIERHHVRRVFSRHHDLFECRIAGPLTDPIDRAFDLPRTSTHTGQRVGNRHPQIVVAMHREDRLIGVRHALAHAW